MDCVLLNHLNLTYFNLIYGSTIFEFKETKYQIANNMFPKKKQFSSVLELIVTRHKFYSSSKWHKQKYALSTSLAFVNSMKDPSIDMLLLCVKITNVMFLNVRKDNQKFAGFIESTRGVNLQ